MACVSIQPWLAPLVAAALAFGVAIGVSLRLALDYAELWRYRRIARTEGPL